MAAVFAVATPAGAQEAPDGAGESPVADDRWNVEQLDRILTEQPGEDVVVSDMVFRRAVLQRYRDELAGEAPPAAPNAAGGAVALWTGGIVYYTFDPSVSVPHQRHFLDAAAEWGAFANMTFVVRAAQANYVTVKDVPGLAGGQSAIGMAGGQQFLSMGSGAWNRMTLLHEIGHTLGLLHEHQRSDRDPFVTILTANIVAGAEGNFVQLPTTNHGPYDFLSVMHYRRDSFSTDPATKNTIVPKAAYSTYLNVMGTQYDRPLSTLDRAGMAIMYGAPTIAPSALVSNTKDSGAGSLRAAVSFAYDRSEATGAPVTTVTFAVPTTDPGFSGGVAVVKPTGAIPSLGNRTVVDGASQTASQGNTNPNGPEVAVDGVNLVAPEQYSPGFVLRGTGSAVKGFVVNGFNDGGVRIIGPAAIANSITGCYVGTNHAGTAAAPNTWAGVWITGGARSNRVGGTLAGEGNLISGNLSSGVAINGVGSNANYLQGNTIGLNRTGAAALPNNQHGIVIYDGAHSNVVGGTAAAARNVISGNAARGVAIGGTGTNANSVQGNTIGLDATGAALPNNHGISIYSGARSNTIGGSAAGAGNVISGNTGQGINISDTNTWLNVVAGNRIGTDAAGTAARPNTGAGIAIFGGAQSNTVGGTAAGARNIISGNPSGGVSISGVGTGANVVQGNTIGLGTTGAALPNSVGVSVFGGAKSNAIGGTVAGAGNVISGNTSQGVNIANSGTTLNVVAGNLIGTDGAGSAARPNSGAGISIFSGAQSNTIGGLATGAGNTVSGNTKQGLTVSAVGTSTNKVQGNRIGLTAAGTGALANGWSGIQAYGGATANTISRNYIAGNGNYGVTLSDSGTNGNLVQGNVVGRSTVGVAVPNMWGGVALWGGAMSNQIGGTTTGAGNVIAGNTSHGVLVMDTATTGNSIRGNAMAGNTGLGINLSGGSQNGAGVTTNDVGDGDTGPNALQNYPVLTSAANGGTLVVQGTLNSVASTTYRVEIFSSPAADPSTYGEANTYLGFVDVTTGAGGTSPTFTFNGCDDGGRRLRHHRHRDRSGRQHVGVLPPPARHLTPEIRAGPAPARHSSRVISRTSMVTPWSGSLVVSQPCIPSFTMISTRSDVLRIEDADDAVEVEDFETVPQAGRTALGGQPPAPVRGMQPPPDLDGGQHLRQPFGDGKAHIPDELLPTDQLGGPHSEPVRLPVPELALQEPLRLLARQPATEGVPRHGRHGEEVGDRLDVVRAPRSK